MVSEKKSGRNVISSGQKQRNGVKVPQNSFKIIQDARLKIFYMAEWMDHITIGHKNLANSEESDQTAPESAQFSSL